MDTVTSNYNLVIETTFVDGDTRTLIFKNPEYEIPDSKILELSNYMKQHNILIGDKVGADFDKIKKVFTRSSTITRLEL